MQSSTPLILSLFPGIGLLDMAFEHEGFCVVRGPDLLWGGDIRRFHPPSGRFDGVIGGPPCQAFSRLSYLVKHNGYEVAPNMFPDFERVIGEAAPTWFLCENVPAAPLPTVPGYIVRDRMVSNREDCGGEQSRERRFSFGSKHGAELIFEWPPPPVPMSYTPAVCASGGGRQTPVAIGGSGKPKRTVGRIQKARDMGYKTTDFMKSAIEAQGLPADFLEHAPFTVAGKIKVVGNGVPLMMGRAVARAVRRALGLEIASST